MSNPQPVPPVIFDTPTLGRAVCLGELYDIRSGKFLGVQLYPQDKVKELETDIRHTELTVSLSTTHHQKATLLDVNAQLSLDVLGGLVKVSGSASYLNDEKSNTNEYAYALALKMRLKEKRILFAESDLGRNVLSIVEKDYINTKLATHFVSSVVYGGNYIVNLVARQTEMSKEEKIEGKLQASFDKLKGAISLEGSVEAKMKGEFKDMDDKFDLVVHGDVALQKVPITPKDVLDTFPEAASLITDGGGVPISVTLQPIPPDLYKGGLIYQIEDDLVDTILAAFSDLDDLHSRFLVLLDSSKRLQDFVPELARTARVVTAAYIKEHSALLHQLAKFLQDHKLGNKPDHAPLLADVTSLYLKHLELDDESAKVSSQYPSTLVGLENELSRFQYLIADIRTVRSSLEKASGGSDQKSDKTHVRTSVYLSGLEDVCRAIRTQAETLLLIMTPISGDDSNYDLTILEYLAIVRNHGVYFGQSSNAAHMFYAENLDKLERRLRNGGHFSELKVPAAFTARVDGNGKLTWISAVYPDYAFELIHSPNDSHHLTLGVDALDSKKAFSLQIRAKEATSTDSSKAWERIICFENWDHNWFLSFRKGFGVEYCGRKIQSKEGKKPDAGKEFTGTFVQDIQNHQWILYLDGDEIARESFTESELTQTGTKMRFVFQNSSGWWDGQLLGFNAFARALTEKEAKSSYSAWKGGQS